MEANLTALQVLRRVQAEDRAATPAEQHLLARWGGWGAQGVWQVLDEGRAEFAGVRAQLQGLLSPQEFAAARLTTINAHYTDPAVVEQVWAGLGRLGFDQGRVLEHLVSSIPAAIERATEHAENLEHTREQARRLHGQPFKFTDELAEARHRYARITCQLQMQANQETAWEVVTAPSANVPDPRAAICPGRGTHPPRI